MLRCIYCEHELSDQQEKGGYLCRYCNKSFACEDGICDFLSKKSDTLELFPENSFDLLFKLESDSFWFSGRNLLIKNLISNHLPLDAQILEIGCGTGFVSSYLKKIGYRSLDCGDIYLSALRYCREREAARSYYLFDLQCSPFFEHYDAVCAFDVLEHIDDDKKALMNLHNGIRGRGFLFLTVPANNLLWSEADIYAKHKRRYSREELIQQVERAGFDIVQCSYFMSLLFPVLLMHRRFSGYIRRDATNASSGDCFIFSELKLNPVLNRIFCSAFLTELVLLKYVDFSFGSSLFCVAQKK